MIFYYCFYDFNVLMLKLKKYKNKIILIYFQVKNTFKKHNAPQYQINNNSCI